MVSRTLCIACIIMSLYYRGLFVGGKFIKERLAAIANELPEYDIACLQEVVWRTSLCFFPTFCLLGLVKR